MSAQASDPPSQVRPPASSRYSSSFNQMDLPQRSRSTALKPQSVSSSPQRSNSHSQTYSRPPSSSRQANNLANIARKDVEELNVAGSLSPRRSSVERQADRHGAGSQFEPSRPASQQRVGSKPAQTRYSAEAAAPITTSNSAQTESRDRAGRSSAGGTGQVRKRTTIIMKTGEWALGKTIGAGSMGKVKLAKNMETGEQVSNMHSPAHHLTDPLPRVPSKLYPGNPPMSTEPLKSGREPMRQKRSGHNERRR